jgi:hypothetical protein
LNNEQILQELERLAARFKEARIPLVALKGICFVLTIYPDIGLRPMVDLDLLVPSDSFPDALQIAYHSGYEKVLPEAVPGADDLLNHAACLVKKHTPFTNLELHYTLIGEETIQYAVPIDWFWTQTVSLDRSAALTDWKMDNLLILTPTAQLLYACAHVMLQHGGRNASLRWMYDLDRLVRVNSEQIDWKLLLDQARKFEWGSAVNAVLSELESVFHTPVPPAILEAFSTCTDGNAKRIVEMHAFPGTHTMEEYQKLKSLRLKGKIKLVMGLVTPSPGYMRWRYGVTKNRDLLYWYFYRWYIIAKDGFRTILHLIKHIGSQVDPPARIG